jgi:hypothetical protein
MNEMMNTSKVQANGGLVTVGAWNMTNAYLMGRVFVRVTCRDCGNVSGHARAWNVDSVAASACRKCEGN